MDCAPTQTLEVSSESFDEGEEEAEKPAEPWGRLFPLGKAFVAQDLVKEEYSFGRGDTCDYCIETQHAGNKVPHFLTLSKTHFRVYRDKSKSNDTVVFIEDKSSNGTYINGELIGKNKKRVLNSDDEIALSLNKNKVFIFNDCTKTSESEALPKDFKDKYTLSKILGRGACGEVRLAFDKETCQKFAVKAISKKTFSVGPVLGRAALEEVKILKAVQHPCIILVQDVFDTPSKLFIVLELAEGGELFDRVVKVTKFSEELSKFYFYQMLVAIKYLHDRNITHRDIKPENILLASDEEETLIKVTDFGLSKFVGENSLMKTLCGTPSYLAPEVLLSVGTTGYSKAIDLWSAGVILFIMLAGYPPFSDEIKDHTLKDQITQGRYTFHADYWKGVSEDAKDMVRKLLTVRVRDRITVRGALAHPWMQDKAMIDRVEGLLQSSSCAANSSSRPGQKRHAASPDGEETTPTNHEEDALDGPAAAKRPSRGGQALLSTNEPPLTPTTPRVHLTPSSSTSSNSTPGPNSDINSTPRIHVPISSSSANSSSTNHKATSKSTVLLDNPSNE